MQGVTAVSVERTNITLPKRPAKAASATEEESEQFAEEAFVPLSAEEARAWRANHPQGSLWRVWLTQVLAGALAAGGVWLYTGRGSVAMSAAYGALAVVLPAALFLRRTVGRPAPNSGAALLNLFLWELVKIAMTIGLLIAAPRLVMPLSWPAMLVGLVVAVQVYWVALMRMSLRTTRAGSTATRADTARGASDK